MLILTSLRDARCEGLFKIAKLKLLGSIQQIITAFLKFLLLKIFFSWHVERDFLRSVSAVF